MDMDSGVMKMMQSMMQDHPEMREIVAQEMMREAAPTDITSMLDPVHRQKQRGGELFKCKETAGALEAYRAAVTAGLASSSTI